MNTLLLKLIVTPVLIGAASLAGRRWGETLSGWFIGLPLTSGPVCWFLAIEQGTGFAAAAARGCLAGAAAEAGFCLAYAIAARKCGWICSLAAGTLAFATGAALFQIAHPPLWMLALIVYAALTTALSLMPELATGRAGFPEPPAWDLRRCSGPSSAGCSRRTRSSERCWPPSPTTRAALPRPDGFCAAS
jgi:hypothetical protein